jgi:hypothetical protein
VVMSWLNSRGVINGKAAKAAALPKFSDVSTLSQSREADYADFASPKIGLDYAPGIHVCLIVQSHFQHSKGVFL